MDNKQKQRVIGIIFLVVLAVVAIPAFLKRSGASNVVSPTNEETLNTQGSPSVLPVEPLKEQDQSQAESSQSVSTLPSEPVIQPSAIPDQPVTAQQPVPAQAAPTVSQEESQEPMPGEVQSMPQQVLPPRSPAVSSTVGDAPVPAEPIKQAVVKKTNSIKPNKNNIKNNVQAPKSDWIIRLAILSVRANADKLIKNMKKHGYIGHIEEINTYKGMTYKVTLKTHSSRAEADKLGQKLNKLFHINVIVNKFR